MTMRLGGPLDTIARNTQLASNTPAAAIPPARVETYAGGTLAVAVRSGDTQRLFVYRALVEHARAAGLSDADAREFADRWTNNHTTLNRRAGEQSAPYTAQEFQALKAKGAIAFDLTEQFDADIIADLNERVAYNAQFKVTSTAYTPEERAALLQQQKGAGANQISIRNKPVLEVIDARMPDNRSLTEDVALARYAARTYNQDGRVWGDKLNELVSLAKTNGVKVENLQVSEDKRTATFNLSAADKQKLEQLFAQALGETLSGEEAGRKGQQEAVNQFTDIGRMYANGAVNTVNRLTEPLRGTLTTLDVETSAAKLPNVEYQSEYGQKVGKAGEIGAEIGLGAVSAPSLLRTAAGKVIFGVSGTYNVAAGAAGVDPTEKDARGNAREMSALERGLRIVGGAAEVLGARPTPGTIGKTGTAPSQTDEIVEALTPDGQTVRVVVPKQGQTADELNTKIVTVDSNGQPSGTRFRDDYEAHVKTRDYSKASQKTGVSGAHEMSEFEKYAVKPGAAQTKDSINIVSKTPHPTIKGIFKIEYQMPKLDIGSQPTGTWRNWKGTTPFTKTVYDSSVISDAQMAQWGREAFAEAQAAGRVGSREWTGYTPSGLKIHGYLDSQGTNAVRGFFVEF